MTEPLPVGFRISLDADARQVAEGTWFGGSPERVVRLSAAGRAALAELSAGPVASRNAGIVARRLTDAGLAHPQPPVTGTPDITVVVPVRDRADMLDRCLAGLGSRFRVVVVDDASGDPGSVADVVRAHGATLVRRQRNGGAGPARNTGLDHVETPFVAFVDSDCVPAGDWIQRLASHFADPLVAAVAPRVTGLLDLGDRPARVQPTGRVAYVPTAALLVRRAALAVVGAFDESIGRGEDTDLVWRLHESGWRVRYDPDVVVAHHETAGLVEHLARRFRYGRSAAPLAVRHPDAIRPLVLHPWPTLTVSALLTGRPALAGIGYAGSVVAMSGSLRRAGLPDDGVPRAMADAAYRTWLGIGRYAVQYGAPVLVLGLLSRHRVAVASLLFGSAVVEWARDPRTGVVRRVADDVAYGAGVWAGCVRARSFAPLRPRLGGRALRVD